MRRILLYLMATVVLTSCFSESPRDRRRSDKQGGTSENQAFFDWYSQNNPNTTGGGDTTVPTDDGSDRDNSADSGTTTNPIQVPDKIKHCSWSQDGESGFAASNEHLQGAYTVCKSKEGQKSSQLDIYFQVGTVITDSQLCFIPTTNQDNKIIYVGEARCLNVVSDKQIYQITLIANRFSNSIITGVMIMKDKTYLYPAPFYQYLLSPDAYFFCSRWLDQTGDPSYCQAFKSVGQYVYAELL